MLNFIIRTYISNKLNNIIMKVYDVMILHIYYNREWLFHFHSHAFDGY